MKVLIGALFLGLVVDIGFGIVYDESMHNKDDVVADYPPASYWQDKICVQPKYWDLKECKKP